MWLRGERDSVEQVISRGQEVIESADVPRKQDRFTKAGLVAWTMSGSYIHWKRKLFGLLGIDVGIPPIPSAAAAWLRSVRTSSVPKRCRSGVVDGCCFGILESIC